MFKKAGRVAVVLLSLSLTLPFFAKSAEPGREPRLGRRDVNPIVRIIKKTIRTLSDVITVPTP